MKRHLAPQVILGLLALGLVSCSADGDPARIDAQQPTPTATSSGTSGLSTSSADPIPTNAQDTGGIDLGEIELGDLTLLGRYQPIALDRRESAEAGSGKRSRVFGWLGKAGARYEVLVFPEHGSVRATVYALGSLTPKELAQQSGSSDFSIFVDPKHAAIHLIELDATSRVATVRYTVAVRLVDDSEPLIELTLEEAEARLAAAQARMWEAYVRAEEAYGDVKSSWGTEVFDEIEAKAAGIATDVAVDEMAKVLGEIAVERGVSALGAQFARAVLLGKIVFDIARWAAIDAILVPKAIKANWLTLAELEPAIVNYESARLAVERLEAVAGGDGVTDIALSAGGGHTCAVIAAGVKCWGGNYEGQLGDGTTSDRAMPVDVTGLASGMVAVSAGNVHTCALTTAGGVKCWGNNRYGWLGDGTSSNRAMLVDVTGLASGMVAVSAGNGHSCALTTAGGVKCWGANYYSQLGDGTDTKRTTPVDVTGLASGAVAVSAGYGHTCALTTSGGVKCWGQNNFGQLGDGTTTRRSTPVDVVGLASGVQSVSAGENHTCAVTESGGLKCWGYNRLSQLGDGVATNRTTPVEVVGLASGVVAVSAGENHTCAVTESGDSKCWGYSPAGLGDGTSTFSATPVDVVGMTTDVVAVSAGGAHTCAVTTDGGLKCWGSNYLGQLGDGTATARTVKAPVDVAGLAATPAP